MSIDGRRIWAVVVAGAVILSIDLAGRALGHEGSRSFRVPRPEVAFQVAAHGRPAPVDDRWTIRPSGPTGLIVAAAICGTHAFLVDSLLHSVHQIDLDTGRERATIGTHTDGTSDLEFPTGISADCDLGTVYVVDHKGVVVFDASSGAVLRIFPKPRRFIHGVGPAILDRAHQVLYVPGLWTTTSTDWLVKSLDDLFEGDRIGLALDLTTGSTRSMFAPIERGCWSSSPNCPLVTLDQAEASDGVAWVAAHRLSTTIGLFSASGQLMRTLDVRSSRFLEDGRRMAASAPIQAKIRWEETNSMIHQVYAFGSLVAVVHSVHATKDWKRGTQIDFDVFMNLYNTDGTPVLSDERLAGLPVARDDTGVYTIDYGAHGRRKMGAEPFTLSRTSIAAVDRWIAQPDRR